MPPRLRHQIATAFEETLQAYELAEARHDAASALSIIARLTDAGALHERTLAQLSWHAFKAFEDAADLLVNAPMPGGDRGEMARAHCFKAKAVARFTSADRGCTMSVEWRELLASDKARIPLPTPRLRKAA